MAKKPTKKQKQKFDAQGFPYLEHMEFRWRITLCCGAVASCDENGVTYCKGCYRAVDPAYGDVVADSPAQKMGHPVRVTLRKQ